MSVERDNRTIITNADRRIHILIPRDGSHRCGYNGIAKPALILLNVHSKWLLQNWLGTTYLVTDHTAARTIGRIKSYIRARRYQMACRKSSAHPLFTSDVNIFAFYTCYTIIFPFVFQTLSDRRFANPDCALLTRRFTLTIVINILPNTLSNIRILYS